MTVHIIIHSLTQSGSTVKNIGICDECLVLVELITAQ